jgi:hypothetical protein
MRPNSKLSVCLVAIGMGLMLVFCSSVWPQDAEKAKAQLKELQQKRLVVLEQMHDVARNLFQNARVELTEVLATERQLLAARLEFAETKQDRIKVCDDALKVAGELHALTEVRKQAARGTALAVLQAQDYELEIQIAREKAAAEN